MSVQFSFWCLISHLEILKASCLALSCNACPVLPSLSLCLDSVNILDRCLRMSYATIFHTVHINPRCSATSCDHDIIDIIHINAYTEELFLIGHVCECEPGLKRKLYAADKLEML